MKTYVLYGTLHGVPLLMFFDTKKDRKDWIKSVPGNYNKMTMKTVLDFNN